MRHAMHLFIRLKNISQKLLNVFWFTQKLLRVELSGLKNKQVLYVI